MVAQLLGGGKPLSALSRKALLGVSLTGIMDHPVLSDGNNPELERWLGEMRDEALLTNMSWSKKLGINQATAITCVKPSGTVSQLVDCASGIHPRFSQYYIRRVRADKKDPLTEFLLKQSIPVENDLFRPDSTAIFSFPQVSQLSPNLRKAPTARRPASMSARRLSSSSSGSSTRPTGASTSRRLPSMCARTNGWRLAPGSGSTLTR